ncbi:MAG: aspartate-alanine antiporter [Bacteroides sp.]|nr:aspartate-alanine antiporter [Bacteroides sp.]
MEKLINILREYPAIVLFFTVGVGFMLGRLKYKSFSLGSVTAVLITGVIVGQLDIPITGPLKSVFFMMFLFSIGYSVGPQFFRSLKGMGLKQVLFAILMSASCFGITILLAKLFAYNAGETVGLFSGSQTCSALIGVGGDAIMNQPGDQAQKEAMVNIMPVCYAVTYIFGTLGTVIILGNIAPRFMGGLDKVREQTAQLESQMDESAWLNDPVNINAMRQVVFRTFRIENDFYKGGRTVAEAEKHLRSLGKIVYFDRVRRLDGSISVIHPQSVIMPGETVVICGRRKFLIDEPIFTGPEVTDEELLHYPVERIPVLVASKKIAGHTLHQLHNQSYMHGVVIEEITRADQSVPFTSETVIERNDTIVLVGRKQNLRRAADHIGYMDIPTSRTDIMFLGLAIFIGGLFGAIPIVIDNIPISFGTSGGSLIAGLVFGWLRSRRPTFGKIPDSALWLMNNLGLNVFIAVVGINAAPSFVAGLRSVGPMLLVAGVIGTTIPLIFGLWLGHKVFKFHPALTLGCCAGTRTCTAALGAVQDTLGSTLPAMGYTVTYAVSNIMLVIWGMIAVLLTI